MYTKVLNIEVIGPKGHKIGIMKMEVYLRRNLDIPFECEIKDPSKLQSLFPSFLSTEQQAQHKEAEEARKRVIESVWNQVESFSEPMLDLLGNKVTRETHEVGFDYEEVKENGVTYMQAVKCWIRPKKSEYAK